jgi:hypothetical protein
MISALIFSLAASESERHYHGGKLKPYEIGPPSVLLSAADETRLRGGRAVLQTVAAEDGTRRMIMVQDIQAPSNIVLGCAAVWPLCALHCSRRSVMVLT